MKDNATDETVSLAVQSLRKLLIRLAQKDSASCCSILNALQEALCLSNSESLSQKLQLVNAELVVSVATHATDTSIIPALHRLAIDLAEHIHESPELRTTVTNAISLTFLSGLAYVTLHGSPALEESALHLHGYWIDSRCTREGEEYSASFKQDFRRFIHIVKCALRDTNVALQ